MNRQPASTNVHKSSAEHNHDMLFKDDHPTGGDPEFYRHSNNHLDDEGDVYDFSRTKTSLNLESSSNNPTDDEEEGK